MARKIDEQQRMERINQILDGAVRVFSKKGLTAKISEIAKEAGLSQGHVYNHFESKEQILMAIICQSQETYTQRLDEVNHLACSAMEKLVYLTETFLKKNIGEYEKYAVLFQANYSELLSQESKSAIVEKAQENINLLMTIIRDGQTEGTIMDGDTRQLAILYTTLLQNLLISEIRGLGPINESTFELLVRLFSAKR